MNITGKLLIAPPSVKGNFWYKTVVMVTEHDKEGSIGIVLNKRSTMTVNEFGQELGYYLNLPGYVYIGGPVNPKSLSFLHTNDWACKNTLKINDEFSVSSADDILPRLAAGDSPRKWRILLGMCGWSPGQLHDEINGAHPRTHRDSWCIATPTIKLAFSNDNKEQWSAAIAQSAEDFAKNILT